MCVCVCVCVWVCVCVLLLLKSWWNSIAVHQLILGHPVTFELHCGRAVTLSLSTPSVSHAKINSEAGNAKEFAT